MDQSVEVQVIPDREFLHRVTMMLLGDSRYSRAWIDTFEDESKISMLDGLRRNVNTRSLEAEQGSDESAYQSTVYVEKQTDAITAGMLIADVEGSVRFQVSNDGGKTWINVQPGKPFTFSKKDRRLVVRAYGKGSNVKIHNVALIW